MASRHEIISIDFRANAAKANPAMDALRESAKASRTEIDRLQQAINEGIKTGKSQAELDNLGSQLTAQEKKLRSFENAMSSLVKGVGTLSRAIDAFNTGTLDQMSAAFQKSSYNAAETAKKALLPGTKDYQKNMAELDALQQKNLENLAKYKLRSEQMLKSIADGGKISSQDLKQEADGIQDLMRLLPHMGNEWTEYHHILTRVNDAIKQQTDNEQRLRGAIVDANDARQRSSQLTREGVENAARQRKEAEEEVAQRNKNIAALKAEREEKAKQVSIDAANAIAKDKEVEKQRKVVAGIKERIANEEKDAERKQKKIDQLNQEATVYENTAKSNRTAIESIKGEVQDLDKELKQVNEDLAKLGGAAPAAQTEALQKLKHDAEVSASAIQKLEERLAEAKRVFGNASAYEKLEQAKLDGMRSALTEQGTLLDSKQAELRKFTDATYDLQSRRNELDWAIEPFSIRHRQGRDHFDIHDVEQQRVAVEKLDEAFRRLVDDDYFKEAPMARKWELLGRSAFGYSDAEQQFGSYERAIRSLGVAAEESGAKFRLLFQGAGVEKSFQGVEFLDGYVSRRKEIAQLNADIKKALGDTNIDELAREVDNIAGSYNKLSGEVQEQEREVARWGKLRQEYADNAAAAERELAAAQQQSTAAKEKEVKVSEEAAKTSEIEKMTLEQLLKRNDELKVKLAELNKEREQILATQKENTAATKEEANAYKDLTKEQAQAMLDQKQQLATFKNEGGKWQITNRQEAQRYLFDALGEINPANRGKSTMSIESNPEKISQLLGRFQERYGIEGESEAMAAVRELMSGGGLVKRGLLNKQFINVEQDISKVAALSKEIKDLTAVINSEVKAVEEVTEKTRTLADVEADTDAVLEESRKISVQTYKLRGNQSDAIEDLTQKTVKLTDAQKERIATIKAETEAIRKMSQEEANAALAEAKKNATVGYKDGKMHMSDPEKVQQFLIGKIRKIGKIKNDDGTLSLAGGQVDALVSAFQQQYNWTDDKANAKKLLKKILQGKEGMFLGGSANLSSEVGQITVQYAKEMLDARVEKMKALVDVSRGVKQATDEVSDATRRGADAAKSATEATDGQTDAIKRQESEVARRKAVYDSVNDEYEQKNAKLKNMRQRYASIPGGNVDGSLEKARLKNEIDDYNENEVKPARAEKNRMKSLWEKAASDLVAMKKAVEDTTAAVKEETKAEDAAVKKSEQLSEADQKRIALEQKRQELETQRGKKLDEIAKKEEKAAGLDVKANNNRSEARQITEELSQAHGKNAEAMDNASEKMKKLEFEQDGLNRKVDEGRKELADYDQKINENASKRLEAEKKQAQAQRLTIDTMTEAIKVLEARNRAIEPESEEWVKNARLIRQYQAELDRLKQQPVLDMMTQRMGNIRNLSADALQETKKFWQGMITGAEHGSTELKEYERNLEKVAKEEEKRRQEIQAPMRKRLNNLEKLSTADLAETKRYWETVRDGVSQTSAAYKKAELAVKALTNEENRRKANVQAQYINDQMKDLNNLSVSGLAEVKRYWQAMADGARRGSDEAKDAAKALSQINEVEMKYTRQQVRPLFGDLSKHNAEEIRAAIEAGRRLIDTYDSGGPAAKRLSQAILDAEEHMKQYGIEAERSARREAQALEEAAQRRKEQDQLMRQQLEQGTSLSESALKTQQQYWQRLIDDPKTAKESLAGYRYELEKTIALQEQQASVTREERADRLNGNLSNYSTAEIREAIEAAKQLSASYKSGSTEATELTRKIVAAEEHINKYSLETERAAKKQREQVATMEKQLQGMTDQMAQLNSVSVNALKAQHSYWQRLIDDPNTATENLQQYQANLAETERLQRRMTEKEGYEALVFFRGDTSDASANEIKEKADALKSWRNELPAQSEADTIAEIDEILLRIGQSAKKATTDVMSLDDALKLAEGAGKEGFLASPQEIQAATKALNERRDAVIKQIKSERELGFAVDSQEQELTDLTKKLRDLKFEQDNFNISQEKMQMLMRTPTNAVNIDELRAAIKRADAELRRMEGSLGTNNEQYKQMAEQVRNAKNVMKEMEGQAEASATAWEKAFSRLKTYVVMYMGFDEVWQKVSNTALDLMDLSDKMGEVRKTTGFTADEVGRLSEELKKMDTLTTLTGLMDLSAAAGQLGLKTQEDVLGFTEAANKLMVALPEMGKEGATEMLKVALATGEIDKIRQQMQAGLIDGSSATAVAMEKVGSTIDRLRATSAATAPAITDFVKRVGAVGAQSGISLDQVAALGSTVDALGMRVEMSATALSRMMPAMRNNAFDIAKILGVTPNTIRELYDTGQGMEVILMILQHIKDTGMDADSIEKMLGMGGMQEIMKELNQQGARAGIVFGGLSQNVDELRRQLGVAKQAYEENIAIQQEYDKMNETTAAKWERLKNQIEEAFVSDTAQRVLGGLIDGLRWLVDFLTGNVGPALRLVSNLVKTFLVYWGVLKLGLGEALFVKTGEGLVAMGKGLKNLISHTQQYIVLSKALRNAKLAEAAASTAAEKAIAAQSVATIKAKMAQEGLNKAMIANVWMAVASAVLFLGYVMYKWVDSQREAGREAAKFQAELDKEQRKVNELTNSIGEARVRVEEANKAVAKARAELDAAKKANDGTTEAVNRLTKAESDLLVKEEEKKNAMAIHKQLITDFNSQYSKYLGFMLSEVSSNLELARARDLVNSKLRETITLKRQEAAIERVEKEKGGKRDKKYGNLYDAINNYERDSKDTTRASRLRNALIDAANNSTDRKSFEAKAKKISKSFNYGWEGTVWRNTVLDYFDAAHSVQEAENLVIEQFNGERKDDRRTSQGDLVQMVNASFSNYNSLLKKYKNSKGDDRARNAAAVLQEMDTLAEQRANASSYFNMNDPSEAALYRKQFGQLNIWKGYDRKKLLKEAGRYYTPRTTMGSSGGSGSDGSFTTTNNYTSGYSGDGIWGNDVDATSTDYSTWDVNELVNRRNQMNKFKNVLKPGIDVRKVLAEDRALMKALDEGKVGEDWQSVLNWYNAERKKIQQELKSERFSTNEGNWRDEKTKNGRKRTNPLVESDYALAELDRYYSRRKEALEKARSEENISEDLYNRQAEMLEQEHLERRSKLRGTFTGEVSKAETAAFRQWWQELEEMDELDHVPWETVESEWSKAIAAQIGRNNLKMQQDMTQLQSITMKHVNQIAKIIAKERPYDGITENLQANLTKLDILFADLGLVTKEQLEDGTLNEELIRRLSFLMGEAEHAYSLTAEQLMTDMGEKGFEAWANAIASAENGEDLKQRLLAQLRTAYDAVQDAIKKEANQIKKQAEIQWNDTTLPNGKSQKQNYDAVLSALGLQEDQVKRANQLIGAGQASERVADKLAIKQMQIRLDMQLQYFALMRKIGEERIAQLKAAGKLEDAEHLKKSLNLTLSEEQKKLDEQRVAIQNQLEESQNRLYTELKSWADLLSSSLLSLFEASHAGDKEYYNELAKLNLTGKGGPGAGTYIVIDNEGTSDARAHYEYLDEREALERQHEIEIQNARAEAWKKVMDDINMKMSEMITDQINAMLQNQSIDANTEAVIKNTEAIYASMGQSGENGSGVTAPAPVPEIDMDSPDTWPRAMRKRAGLPVDENPHDHTGGNSTSDFEAGVFQHWYTTDADAANAAADQKIAAIEKVDYALGQHFHHQAEVSKEGDEKMAASSQSAFAKMTQAMNLYGIAYQAMSNENLSATQKFEMIAIQAAGQAAITSLTASGVKMVGDTAVQTPSVLAKIMGELGPIAGPIAFAAFTALLGGLMGLATSKLTKAKSQIASITGASSGAGRLSTGMLTYAEGNVNEFTDPGSLITGRKYNVDAADGHTYRARYMGHNPRTHLTNGPEFHLSGERGREMIIDAGTTRQITMNEREIWSTIQTLSSGRHLPSRRRRGVRAFADGNVEDFAEMGNDMAAYGTGGMDLSALQSSLDRNSAIQEALLERLNQPIVAQNIWHGPEGIPNMYNQMQKEAKRHGVRYL